MTRRGARQKKLILLSPGPTIVPATVKRIWARAEMHHRVEPFPPIWGRLREKLQSFFEIDNPIPFVRRGGGTEMMEAAIYNTVRLGDNALVLNHGYFGNRFVDMLERSGVIPDQVKSEWGFPIDPRAAQKHLVSWGKKHYRAIFAQATDTSTGVRNDLETIGKIIRTHSNALFVVDAVFEAAVGPIRMEAWGIDVLLCASQKGFMMPEGIGFMVLSERAFNRIADRGLTVPYSWDIVEEWERNKKGDTLATPPIRLMQCLDYVLGRYLRSGTHRLYEVNQRKAYLLRDALHVMGLWLLCEPEVGPRASIRSNGLTVIDLARVGVESNAVVDELIRTEGIITANGQGDLKGKVLRVAHFGAVTFKNHLVPFLRGLERALDTCGTRRNLNI